MAEPSSPSDAPMRKRVLRGVTFTASRGIFSAIVRVVTIAVLARILTPSDFGLVAAVVVVQQLIGMLIQRGLADALVQRSDLTSRDAGTALTILVIAGVLCSSLLWLFAPQIEALIGLPYAADVVRIIGLVITIEALLQVYLSDARRSLRFEWIALIEALAVVTGYSAVSICLALLGFGYWALVGGILGQASVRLMGFVLGSWRCCRPCFSKSSTHRLFGFSAFVTGWVAAGHIFNNVDRIVLAHYMGAEAVGYFSRAKNFISMFIEFYGLPVNQVLFPVLSRLQDEPTRLFNAYRHAVAFSALLGLPSAFAVCALAAPLVGILLGDQWGPAIPVVRVLAFSVFFMIIGQPFVAIVRGMGHVKEPMFLTAGQAIAMSIGAIILYPYGLTAIAILVIILHAVGFIVWNGILAAKLNVSFWSLITPMRAGLIYTCVVITIWLCLTFIADVSTDTLVGAAAFVILAGLSFLALFFAAPNWFLRSELMWTHELALKALKPICHKIYGTHKF